MSIIFMSQPQTNDVCIVSVVVVETVQKSVPTPYNVDSIVYTM